MTVSFQDINILNVPCTIASEFSMFSNFTSTSFSIGWAHLFLILFQCMPIMICSKLATTHLSHADTDAGFARWVALLDWAYFSSCTANPRMWTSCLHFVIALALEVCMQISSFTNTIFWNWVSTTLAQPIALGTLAIAFFLILKSLK